jgi:hypothetical protein
VSRPLTETAIETTCDEIKRILVEKNRAYGDSATNPVRIFSNADPREQLLVRLDDKLSRIARGSALGEYVVLDLIGYLVLLRVQDQMGVIRDPTARFSLFSEYVKDDAADPFDAEKDDMLRAGALGAVAERVRPRRDPRRSEE